MEIKRAIRLKTTRVLILLCKDNSQMRIHLCLQSAFSSACHNDKLCKISSPRKKTNPTAVEHDGEKNGQGRSRIRARS